MQSLDQERRVVAQSLRDTATHHPLCGVLDCDVLDSLGVAVGSTPGCADADDLMHLADLIDRPTCHLVEDDEGRTSCSECGCSAPCMGEARYCPDCGARVVKQ